MWTNARTAIVIAWIKAVLTHFGQDKVVVIQSHQNAPAPKGTYLTVSYAPSLELVGRPLNIVRGVEGENCTVYEYHATIEVRQVYGDGGLLAYLQSALYVQSLRAQLEAQKMTLFSVGSVEILPRLQNFDWVRESTLEIVLAYNEIIIDNVGVIEDIDLQQEKING